MTVSKCESCPNCGGGDDGLVIASCVIPGNSYFVMCDCGFDGPTTAANGSESDAVALWNSLERSE